MARRKKVNVPTPSFFCVCEVRLKVQPLIGFRGGNGKKWSYSDKKLVIYGLKLVKLLGVSYS